MNHLRPRAFATLTAMALLLLLTTWLILATNRGAEVELALRRSNGDTQAAWNQLDELLLSLAAWNPRNQTLGSWLASQNRPSVTWSVLSGKINLNTASPFLLALPELRTTLRGVTPDGFVVKRAERGLKPALEGYSDLIHPASLKEWYSTVSLWNLNTADEGAVELMVSERLASPAVGSFVRSYLRSFREQTRRLTQADWEKAGPSITGPLAPLMTVEPELDVNEMPEELLFALVSSPGWKVSAPAEKVRAIVEGRRTKPWDDERLKNLLAVPEDNLLLSYLGTTSRFVSGTIKVGSQGLAYLIYLPGEPAAPRTPRVLEAVWMVP